MADRTATPMARPQPPPLLLLMPPPPPQQQPQQQLTLAAENAAATALARKNDHAGAVVAFRGLLNRALAENLTHPELHTTVRLNVAASLLALGDHEGALAQAEAVLAALSRDHRQGRAPPPAAHPAHARARLRQGRALLGLGSYEEAAKVLDLGSRSASTASSGVREALACAAAEAAAAAAMATAAAAAAAPATQSQAPIPFALPAPPSSRPSQPVAHPAPPLLLLPPHPRDRLSPANAAEHPALAEAYAFARAQEETEAPWRLLHVGALPSHARAGGNSSALSAAAKGVAAAVRGRETPAAVPAPPPSCVLIVGSAGGVLAVAAMRAGAPLVCVTERSRYLAQAVVEVVRANGFDAHEAGAAGVGGAGNSSGPRCLVYHCRPEELGVKGAAAPSSRTRCGARHDAVAAARQQLQGGGTGGAPPPPLLLLPAPCSVLVLAGLLLSCDCPFASGCLTAAAHLLDSCSLPDATLVPRAVTVRVRAASATTPPLTLGGGGGSGAPRPPIVLRFDALDRYRWQPSPCLPVGVPEGALRYLSPEREAFCFDLASCSSSSSVAAGTGGATAAGGGSSVGAALAEVELDLSEASTPLRFNAVAAWWECEFADGSTARSAQPALHWLPGGEVRLPPPPSSHSSEPQLIVPVVARHNGAALAFEVRAVSSSSSSSFVGGGQAAPSFHLEPTTTAAAAAAASAPDASACRPPLRSAADREVDASTASAPRPPAIPTLALALASDTPRLSILSRAVAKAVARHCAVAGGRPPAVLDAGAGGTAALALAAAAAGAREVVAAEAHPQLAATARANVALNARAVAVGGGRVRVVCGDAARLERGGGVGGGDAPAEGFHLVVFDPCAGADPNSGAPLALLDGIRRRCMAVAAGGSDVAASHPPQPPPRVVPRAATVWAVGLEVLSSALVPGAASPELDDGLGGLPADLSPLDRFRWRGGVACSAEAEGPPGLSSALPPPCRGALAAEVGWDPIHLASLPHVRLTKPARVMTMDFAAALAGGRGSGVAAAAAAGGDSQHHAALRVERAGTLNAVAYWAEMHLGDDDGDDDEASSYSMGPPASYFGAGGGGSGPGPGDNTNGSGPGTDPRGQALQYLETWTSQGGVRPGDVAHLDVRLGSRCVRFRLLGVEAATAAEEERDGDGGPPSPCPLRPCPRAPWLARAGIESPDVWAVRRCHEVLAQALQRAGRAEPAIRGGGGPGQRNDRRRLPAVWRDFFVLLRHCAPLGLDPAVLAQTAQSVALAEALAAVLSGQEEEEGDGGAGGGSSLALLRASALVSPEVLGVRGAAWR